MMKSTVGATTLCALALISAHALAADTAPDKTGDFVAYCAGGAHRKACTARVVQVDIYILATEECSYIQGVDNNDATTAIVAWLAAHTDTASLPTDEGIAKAMKALWPTCKL